MDEIAVLIPCFNEEITVGKVVRDFKRALPQATVYVYDNNSTDKTVEKAKEATLISVSTALIFPVILMVVLWPLGLTGIWMNFAGTAVLAGIMSLVILKKV